MRITNRTRNTLLGTKVVRAASWWSRLRGFIGRPEPMQGEGILLVRCSAIHTWGMAFKLDVLFLDERGTVLKVLRSLAPWKRPQSVRAAKYVLEVPVGTIDVSGTQVGDDLTWRDPAPYRISVLSQQPAEESLKSPPRRRGSG